MGLSEHWGMRRGVVPTGNLSAKLALDFCKSIAEMAETSSEQGCHYGDCYCSSCWSPTRT
eukprot:1938828-Amphidinium_carterae.1